MESLSWTCPYCSRDTTITHTNFSEDLHSFHLNNQFGETLGFRSEVIVCPNNACQKIAIRSSLHYLDNFRTSRVVDFTKTPIKTWNLMPDSLAKQYLDYIPQAIRDDYNEACLIKDLSPKASATLSRRCLQTMIRDFFKVDHSNLSRAIESIQDQVTP